MKNMKNNTVWIIEESFFIGPVMDFSRVVGIYTTRDKALSVAVDEYAGVEWVEWEDRKDRDNGSRTGYLEIDHGMTYRIDIYEMEVES